MFSLRNKKTYSQYPLLSGAVQCQKGAANVRIIPGETSNYSGRTFVFLWLKCKVAPYIYCLIEVFCMRSNNICCHGKSRKLPLNKWPFPPTPYPLSGSSDDS